MTAEALPMFPLGSVLVPGALLPLHVFEPRYQALVQDCIAGTQEFGVVLIARGREVGGGDERHAVGTRAQLVQVARLEGGQYAVMCIGTERIRVVQWLVDDPYPKAMVEDWPDEDDLVLPNRWWDGSGERTLEQESLVSRVRRLAALAVELGDHGIDPLSALAERPVRRSYDLTTLAPLGPSDRLALLQTSGPAARLDALAAMLDDLEAVLRFRLGDDPSPSDSPDAW